MTLSTYFNPPKHQTYPIIRASKKNSYHYIMINFETMNPNLSKNLEEQIENSGKISDDLLNETEDKLMDLEITDKESVDELLDQIKSISESEFNFGISREP